MRITGWSIDGFGQFHKAEVTDLPPGLIVVHGPNESGKTTLMDFVTGMLFGFPDRRSTKRRHDPVNGGTLGGRLFVIDQAGVPVTIERGASRKSLQVRDEHGERSATALADLLGHVTPELFDNVFGVDLDALQGLRSLDEDAVRERIFSAGVVGAGRSAELALASLEARRDELFKPRGRGDGYRLRVLRTELAEATEELRAAQQVAGGITAQRRELDDLRDQVAAHRAHGRTLQRRLELIHAVDDIWPAWSAALDARTQLTADDETPVPDLPDDYEERLADARRQVETQAAATRDAEHEVAKAEEQLSRITVDLAALSNTEAVSRLDQQRGTELARRKRLIELDGHLAHYRAELDQQLARLGPQCDDAWLTARPQSIESEAEMRRIAGEVQRARTTLDRAIQTSRERDRALNLTTERLNKAKAERAAAGDPEAARRRVQDVAALYDLVAKLEQAERDEQTQRIALDAANRTAGSGLPSWLVPAVGGLALLAVLAGAGGLATGAGPIGIGSLVVGIGLAVVAVMLARHRPPAPSTATATAEPGAPVVLPATHDVIRLSEEVAGRAHALGVGARPSTVELMNLRQEAAEAHAAAAGALQTHQEALQTETDHEAYSADIRNVDRQSVADADAELTRATDAWNGWLAEHDLPAGLDPDGVGEFLALLNLARQTQHSLATYGADRANELAESEAFASAVQDVAGHLDEADDDVIRLLDRLVARTTAARDAERDRERLAGVLANVRELHAARAADTAAASTALDAVVAEAGATAVTGAEEVVRRLKERQRLQGVIDEAEKALDLRSGNRREESLELLGTGDPLGWQAEGLEIEQQIVAAEADHDAAAAELTRAEDALAATLTSSDVPHLQLRVESLRAQLQHAAREWAVLASAHRIIEATRERYKRERQPMVVKRAAALFGEITDGRYDRLVVDGSTIFVVDTAGRQVDAASLSRGTVEQLYLCLRFALAEQLATTSPLPLLLDDILVNSDPGRGPRMARTIGQVAERQQVFMFTCHPWVVEMLTNEIPAHVIDLPSSRASA